VKVSLKLCFQACHPLSLKLGYLCSVDRGLRPHFGEASGGAVWLHGSQVPAVQMSLTNDCGECKTWVAENFDTLTRLQENPSWA